MEYIARGGVSRLLADENGVFADIMRDASEKKEESMTLYCINIFLNSRVSVASGVALGSRPSS